MRLVPKEADVQLAIIATFWYKYRIQLDPIDAGGKGFRRASGGGGYSGIPEGFPDLLGAIPPSGRMIQIEVKKPRKRPTDAQEQFIHRRVKEGAVAFWADSVESALEKYAEFLSPRE